MAIRMLEVAGYRSVRDLRLSLSRINVLVGPNGTGKSNLYRSLYLLTRAAQGTLAQALAEEGGMPSVLWAGPRKKGPVTLDLAVTLDDFEYRFSCGLPPVGSPGDDPTQWTLFPLDPLVKTETVRAVVDGAPGVHMLERKNTSAKVRNYSGRREAFPFELVANESVISQLREPQRYPELFSLREEFNAWRFYHQFRTDADSPLRQPQIGVQTNVLAHDGRDLAAALTTILMIGERETLARLLDRAIPGARLDLDIEPNSALFSVGLKMPGIGRRLHARELSDGTLRYLCLLAALLSPRPPALVALNEPETSLHPDLIPPLAELIARASERSQLWITTHSQELAERISAQTGEPPIRLEMDDGETRPVGRTVLGGPQ